MSVATIVFTRPSRSLMIAEDDAARRPSQDHRGGRVADVRLDGRQPRIAGEQFLQRRLAREHEQALVHAVEQPPARRDDDDEPVVPA